jgi:hypothetical protein
MVGETLIVYVVFNQNGANLNVTPSHRCIEYPITSEKICKFAKEEFFKECLSTIDPLSCLFFVRGKPPICSVNHII